MRNISSRATAFCNSEYFYISTLSQGMLDYAEPTAPPHFLAFDVEDAVLGHAMRSALNASRKVSTEEFQKIFHSGVVQKLGKDRDAFAMHRYGYQSRRAMYKNMRNCSISVIDGQIEIVPMHQKSLDGYSATNEGPSPLYISLDANDAHLGSALREAFSRCSSDLK